jgi:hypothetical protein
MGFWAILKVEIGHLFYACKNPFLDIYLNQ